MKKPNDYYVKIIKSNYINNFQLSVLKDEFFNDDVIINIESNKIVFKRTSIDYNGKSYKGSNQSKNRKIYGIASWDIECYYKLSIIDEDYREIKFKNKLTA